MGKMIKAAQEKLRRRLSGKLFRYTFTFSLALHFGIWGLAGFSPRGAVSGYAPEREIDGLAFDPNRYLKYNDLPQPPIIEPEVPRGVPEGLPGKPGLGEIIIPTPDDETDITTTTDADPGRMPIGRNERVIVVDPGADPDKPRSASPHTVEIVEYSKPPVLVELVKPKYPELAYGSGVEGDVVLLVYVDARGNVRNAVVQASPGLPAMEQAALEAAYKCRFEPAEQQGVPVGVWYSLVMEFRL
jgi:TonB family protein